MPQSVNLARTVDDNRVVPLYPGDAKRVHFNIPPSTTIAKGTVVGKYTSSADAVQTVTVTGTPTGGTFTLTGTDPITGETVTTAAIAYNAAASAVASAVEAVFSDGVTVTGGGGALPGTAVTLTFTGSLDSRPVPVLALGTNSLTGGTSPTVTVANTTAGRSEGQVAAYNDAGSGGVETAIGVMEYTVTSRNDGRAVVGSTVRAPDDGEGMTSVPVYLNGHFHADDLTGLDAAALADLGGRQVGDIVIIPGGN